MAKTMRFDENIDMIAATKLQATAAIIRTQRINWHTYLHSHTITYEDYQCIHVLDKNKGRYFNENPEQSTKTFLHLIETIPKENLLQYLLVMFDDLITDYHEYISVMHAEAQALELDIWSTFNELLKRNDQFIVHISHMIITKLAAWSRVMMPKDKLIDFLKYTINTLEQNSNVAIHLEGRCLQMLLRVDEYRFPFVQVDGISSLVMILMNRVNFQVKYQLIFCVWMLTFNPIIAAKINKFGIIPMLTDILVDCTKEKVTRVILAALCNLLVKPNDPQAIKDHCTSMIQCKLVKQINNLEQRSFDDEELNADIDFLSKRLKLAVKDLSSFDEYAMELRSAQLEWSPVHKSIKFWRENAHRLNDQNYELLRILVHLLETSKDAVVLSVACYDIGEYVRHYPRGKQVLEQLDGKQILMQHLGNEQPNVRYEALLAVQKLMAHNWEYLKKF